VKKLSGRIDRNDVQTYNPENDQTGLDIRCEGDLTDLAIDQIRSLEGTGLSDRNSIDSLPRLHVCGGKTGPGSIPKSWIGFQVQTIECSENFEGK